MFIKFSIKSIAKNIILSFLLLFLLVNCQEYSVDENPAADFVYLENNKFMINDSVFFPKMINYTISFRKIGETFFIAPLMDYEIRDKFETNSKDSSLFQVEGHFKLIKEMGFNAIRIGGFPELISFNRDQNEFAFSVLNEQNGMQQFSFSDKEIYFDRIQEILDIASKLDLKIMLLLKCPMDESELLKFTGNLFEKFQDSPTIFAYDFFNEPLYFDNADLTHNQRARSKKSALKIVRSWEKLVRMSAPNHLFTIGFVEPIEVFEWDPEILPVDFLAIHTYHPLRVPNEIYWYTNYINKPWMIGETSLPADNDSVPYVEQAQFMREAYKRVVDCGGSGFGWWSFQDVNWGGFEHDYTSLLNREGYTYTEDSIHKIVGTVKPAGFVLPDLQNYVSSGDCPCKENYYNMLGYENIVLTGKVINKQSGQPIEGAVIRGWNRPWSVAANTFTCEDGTFTLYSNTEFVHFNISAPGMSFIRFNKEVTYHPVNENSLPLDSLPNQELEYHGISYKPFLTEPDYSTFDSLEMNSSYIFNFKDEMFNKKMYTGSLGEIKLSPFN